MHWVALLIPRVSEKYMPVRRNSMEMCYSPWKIGCGSGCFLKSRVIQIERTGGLERSDQHPACVAAMSEKPN
jgi:hypothetical protein